MRKLGVLGVFLALLLVGCGGGSSPSAPTPQPFSQSIAGNVGVFGTTAHNISVPRAGTMRLTLSWTGGVDLDLYLTNSGCSEFAVLATCQLLGQADGFVNPESITRSVTANESFRVFVDNNSLTQSVNYTLAIRVE